MEPMIYQRVRNSNTELKGNRDVDELSIVDHFVTNAHSSQGVSQLCIFEDNQAVIKMIIKGSCPTMRHVSRTHRVALDWLFLLRCIGWSDTFTVRSNLEPTRMRWNSDQLVL